MNLPQLFGCEHILATLERFNLIGNVELLEEPEDALGARLFEPGRVLAGWFLSVFEAAQTSRA